MFLASRDTGQQNGLGRPEDQTRDAENQMSRWQKKQPQTDLSFLEEFGKNEVSAVKTNIVRTHDMIIIIVRMTKKKKII